MGGKYMGERAVNHKGNTENSTEEIQKRLLTLTKWLFGITVALLVITVILSVITFIYADASYRAGIEIIKAEKNIGTAIQDLPQIKMAFNDLSAIVRSTGDNLTVVANNLERLQTTITTSVHRIRVMEKLNTIRDKINYFENNAIPELERYQKEKFLKDVPADSTRTYLNSVIDYYNRAEDALYKDDYSSVEQSIKSAESSYQILLDDYKNKVKDYLAYPVIE
jgi:hypothetical protein